MDKKHDYEELERKYFALEQMMQSIGAGVVLISREYKTIWANKVMKNIFGDNIEGKYCYITYNHRENICPNCGVKKVLEEGAKSVVHEQSGKDEKGNPIWSQIIANPIYDKDGNIESVLEIVTPITERKLIERKHIENVTLLRNVLDALTHPFYVIDTQDFTIKIANKASGYSNFQAGTTCYNLTHKRTEPCSGEKHPCPIKTILATKKPTAVEHVHYGQTGNKQYVTVHGYPVLDHEQNVRQIIEYCLDNTARRQAMDELQVSENKYRTLIDTSPYGIQTTNREGVIIFSNTAHHRILGYDDGELIGMHIWDLLVTEEERNALKGYYQHIMNEPVVPEEVIYKNRRKDGRTIDVQINWDYMRNTAGKIFGANAIITDITEREQAKTALQQSEKHFRDLAENALTGIMIVQDAQVVYHNQEMARMFDMMQTDFCLAEYAGIHPDDQEMVNRNYHQLMTGEVEIIEMDFRYYQQVGENLKQSLRWVHCRACPLEYGIEKSILFNIMDITKSRELEQMITIQDKMSSLGRVAAGIAHEIRNPLSTINVYLSALANLLPEDAVVTETFGNVAEILKEMKQASGKIESVVRRVMDFSKPTRQQLKLTSVNDHIRRAVELSAVTLRKSGITIELELAEGLPSCYLDPQLTVQLILNLITNAIEAMKDNNAARPKHISISSSPMEKRNKKFIRIEVADSGPGVPAGAESKIFDPFYTTKPSGTGIGLSICQRIVNDQQGTITLGTSAWGGARFTIMFPVEKRGR